MPSHWNLNTRLSLSTSRAAVVGQSKALSGNTPASLRRQFLSPRGVPSVLTRRFLLALSRAEPLGEPRDSRQVGEEGRTSQCCGSLPARRGARKLAKLGGLSRASTNISSGCRVATGEDVRRSVAIRVPFVGEGSKVLRDLGAFETGREAPAHKLVLLIFGQRG